jgi:CheY-like chemotaxis protein
VARLAIVDADPQERASIVATLRAVGHEVLEWGLARAALTTLLAREPDALVVARDLADGDGLELVARLRAQHKRPFPTLVVSADAADAARAAAVGATLHVKRPVDLTRLIAAVAQAIREEPLGLDLPRDEERLVFGRYSLLSVLGRGSFGMVYEAWDVRRRAPVALKVLAPAVDGPDDLARFVREARVLSRVHDPHVVTMLDTAVVDGRAFCSMRLVPGVTLDVRVQRRVLSEREALALLWGLLQALHAMAQQGLVHRDVTPRNVILEDDEVARPVLIDFGLAKPAQDQGLTAPDVLLGTPGYIAPEVVCGAPADIRSDLFSAGLVVLCALQGRHPFDGLRGMVLVRATAERPVPIPVNLSPGTRVLLARLTHLDPDQRPARPVDALATLGRLAHSLGRSADDVVPAPTGAAHQEVTEVVTRRCPPIG